nr:immunoglobulin light chain junction region [Macaca mulatta]
CIQVLQTPFTF